MRRTDFCIFIVKGEPVILTNCLYMDDDNQTIMGSQLLKFERELHYVVDMVAMSADVNAAIKYAENLVVPV